MLGNSCGQPSGNTSVDLAVQDITQNNWGIGCVTVIFDTWTDTSSHITYNYDYGASDCCTQYWFHHGDNLTVCVTNPGTLVQGCGSATAGAPSPDGAGGNTDSGNPLCQHGAHPINCATGEFWHTFDDLAIPRRGVPLHFTHSYSSQQAAQNGTLGYGWTVRSDTAKRYRHANVSSHL